MNNCAQFGAMPWMNPELNREHPDPGEAAKSARIEIGAHGKSLFKEVQYED